MPKAELPPEAPKPDTSKSDIKQFILDNSVCFYHARDQQCPCMVAQGCCPYSNAQQPVPWGAYARIQQKSSSAQTQHDVMPFESALDDKSMLYDLPGDEFSETEALSFN